jgi:glycosyltransferase involved in cell wall biosynthesis
MGGDILADEQVGQNGLERWLTHSLLRRADLVTSKSAELTGHLTRIGVAPWRILPLVWGVDEMLFRRRDASTLRGRLGLAPTARVVLSPRALRPFYNIHVIVDAFAAVAASSPDAVLVITEYQADAAYRDSLRQRIKILGLADRVRFVGEVGIDEMADYYSLAEVVVSIPASDGIPQSLLEALACGVPVILSDLQCYREWVTDEVSALMTVIKPADLAAAMGRLLEDGRLRTNLAAAGLEVVAKGGGLQGNLERLDVALSNLPQRMDRRPSFLVLAGVTILVMARAVAARLPFLRQ